MKNVAIITDSLSRGGAERAAGYLSVFLSKQYNVYIFAVENYDITYKYSGTLINLDLNLKYKKMQESKKIFKRILAKTIYLSTISEMKKMKKKYKIDYSISFLELMSLMNIFSHYKDKVIVSVRNNRSMQNNCFLRKLENWSIRKFYNKTHKVISLSYGVTEDLVKNFNIKRDKIETIYNFYDVEDMIKKSNQELDDKYAELYKNNKIIMTMGRLIEQKNLLNLVEIMSKYLVDKDDTKFLIFGQGPLKVELEKLINKYDMDEKIILCGYSSNPFPMIKNSDLFIINSLFEGFCNSIVEAMSCGTYVISTDCKYGPRELIADKKEYESIIDKFTIYDRGILTPIDKPNEMYNAIKYILENDNIKQKGEKTAFEFVKNMSNEILLEKWLNVIEGDIR